MRYGWRGLAAAWMALALAACGGGGGGGGGGSPAALSFAPASLTANVEAGATAAMTVVATATDPSVFSGALYIYVVDSRQVLSGTINLTPVDARSFSATVFTSPSLPTGAHTGTLQIQLCKDANCAAQYPGSPVPLNYSITVTPSPLRASAATSTAASVHWGASRDQAVGVTVSGPELEWTASTAASWLQISGGSGRGAGAFSVTYVTPTLSVGSYGATVTVRSSDGQTSDVPFSLVVMPTQFALSGPSPQFTAVNGSAIAAQSLDFALDSGVNSAWNAASSQPWLLVTPTSGSTPATLSMQPDPTRGPLASGEHLADVTLRASGIADRAVSTRLTLLAPSLNAPSASLTLGGSKGRDVGSAQTLPISLNTGDNAHPWTLSGLPAWLSSSTPSGTVNGIGTMLSVAPVASAASVGTSTATVTVRATVNGDVVTLPITANLHLDQRRLLPSRWGVGLASTPLGSVLSRTLRVADNFGAGLAWTATSDSAWLSVTGSGSTNGASTLTLSADPTTLPDGVVSQARVTISTTTPGVESAVVRVALWKNAIAPAAVATLPIDYQQLTADAIRPLVYAHAGGGSIDVYNAYTATKVATIASVGAALGQMTVSPDGSRLFVPDTANRSLAVVDLDSRSKVDSWPLDQAADAGTPLLTMRPNGVEVVLIGHGRAYSAGRSLGSTGIVGSMSASADGRRVFTQDMGLSPASVAAFDVDYSAIAGGVLMVAQTASAWNVGGASNGRDIAVSADASALFTASGYPYACSRIAPTDLSFVGGLPGGSNYPNNVEITSDGRVICGIDGIYSTADFWVHGADGVLLGSYDVAGALEPGQMVVSPDGLLVVVLSGYPAIGFVAIGAP